MWNLPTVPMDSALDELMAELVVEVARANRRTNGLVSIHFNRGKWLDVKYWDIILRKVVRLIPRTAYEEPRINRENLEAAIKAVKNI